MRPEQIFAATAVLRPINSVNSTDEAFKLAFYNPLYQPSIHVGDAEVPIAGDITAPIAYLLDHQDREWLTNFLQPGHTDQERGLQMFEPYQRGKIPIIFVHGLLSDPSTWADLGNELRSHSEITSRYQFWTFSYNTGAPFLRGAATLRRQLREIRMTLDPNGTDPALSQIILIGHSMGGLVAKLQVTSSGDRLWSSVSNQPLHSINSTPETRRRLADDFFFEPSPAVARVIFVATPHRGAGAAQRLIGRIGSALAGVSAEDEAQHEKLIQANPGVFSRELRRRIPTSIDLLEPNSQLLNSVLTLPIRPGVEMHSIIGGGYWSLTGGSSDTVVPVSSARLINVSSEVLVHAKHMEVHQEAITVHEVMRILDEHGTQYNLESSSGLSTAPVRTNCLAHSN